MRNLKRALSLAMASVMLLGLMVVGSSAASYTDVTSKENQEAIEVLKAVGVMTGDEKGNFNPTANVTRNEMAVVMSNLMDYRVASYKGTAPFSDVPAWAEPYVAACYTHGIIAGTSATTFGGDETVTAAQAALMLMKALGYFEYQSDFENDWQLATVKQAAKIDLYDGVNAGVTDPLNRNEVAQMVLNTLKATTVEPDDSTINVSTPDGTTVQAGKIQYNTVYKTGSEYMSIDKEDKDGSKYSVELGEELYKGDLKKSSSSDDFNRPATRWTYNGEIGVYAETPDAIYTAKVEIQDIYADLGLSEKQDISVYVNGDDTIIPMTLSKRDDTKTADVDGLLDKGTVMEFFVDDDKNVTAVAYNYYLAQATSDYDKDDEELDIEIKYGSHSAETLDLDDFANIADMKEDDFMLVTVAKNGDDYNVKSVEAVTVVSDVVVTAAKSASNVTAGGTKYDYAVYTKADSNVLGYDLMSDASYKMQDDGYNLYLDPNGYVVGVEGAKSDANLDDYLFVKDISTSGFDVIAKVSFMDGTSKTITVAEVDEKEDGDTGYNFDENEFYTFNEKKNGEYELTSVGSRSKDAGAVTIDPEANGAATPIDGVNKSANSKTVFIADDKVYTGVKNAPTTKGENNVYYLLDKDSKYILAVYTKDTGKNVTKSEDVVYILSTSKTTGKDGDDNTYYTYDAIVDGKKTTIDTNEKTLTKTGLYEIDSYTDGYADLTLASGGEYKMASGIDPEADVSHKDGIMTIDGVGAYVLSDDVQLFTVDGTTVKTISASGLNNLNAKFTNVSIVSKNDDKDAETIMVFFSK